MDNDCFRVWQGAVDPPDWFNNRPESSILRLPGGRSRSSCRCSLPRVCPKNRPLIALLKPGSVLQLLLVHVEDELVLVAENSKASKAWRTAVTHAQEAAEGEHRVGHAVLAGVNQQFLDLAHISRPGD